MMIINTIENLCKVGSLIIKFDNVLTTFQRNNDNEIYRSMYMYNNCVKHYFYTVKYTYLKCRLSSSL